jgi:hypothetical protein
VLFDNIGGVRRDQLLIGDAQLRALAGSSQIEVHRVLWIAEKSLEHQLATKKILHGGLSLVAADPAVRLPQRALAAIEAA